jgi:hypothetical protein
VSGHHIILYMFITYVPLWYLMLPYVIICYLMFLYVLIYYLILPFVVHISKGKRSIKPFKLRVLNVSRKWQKNTKNMFTVAFGPEHQYTTQELLKLLEKTVKSASNRGQALSYINRRMLQQFYRSVLGQIETTMFQPVLLRVGGNDDPPVKFVILSPTWCNDNEECYSLASCNLRSSQKTCRICDVERSAMHQNGNPACLRNGAYLSELTERAEIPFLKLLTKPLNARNILTSEERDIVAEVKNEGILPGKNPLHDYMFWFSFHGIADVYSAQLPDMLHTLYKGAYVYFSYLMLPYVSLRVALCSCYEPYVRHKYLSGLAVGNIERTVAVIYAVSHLNRSCLCTLDTRLKCSPNQQTVNPFSKKSAFPKGYTKCMFAYVS